MITCTCLIQQGQSPDLHKGELLVLLNEFTRAAFGEEAHTSWTAVAPGNGFTAGRPSTSSFVSIAANEKLSPARRKALLQEFVAMWTDKTGNTIDEIVAVIADPTDQVEGS